MRNLKKKISFWKEFFDGDRLTIDGKGAIIPL